MLFLSVTSKNDGIGYQKTIWMSQKTGEYLKNVSFTDDFESQYLKAVRITLNQEGKFRMFDLALTHCSVAILLYHIEFKKFLVVRQFRPAVFVSWVTKLPENEGKSLNDIHWSKFDTFMGYTLELCAGLIDKDIPIKEIAREEIEEECGYKVNIDKKVLDAPVERHLRVSADESGNTQYLFYAEIDESMKVSEGGGNISEGEDITKGSMTRSWDMALRADSIAILLYNRLRNSIILNQRFRPATLIGRTRHIYSKNRNMSQIDWKLQPLEWAYTLELCSGHHGEVNDIEDKARSIVATKTGYSVMSLDFVTSFILGISQSGDRQHLYYGEVDDSSIISGYSHCEDIVPRVQIIVGCSTRLIFQD
uniref:Nudix hydrolase domain-containing protein n=1 Tax=Heterorhabditis bacteriophora TaxID=37862 RepID=A0A1I7WQF6_HETBA